jgi:hypothetical protein
VVILLVLKPETYCVSRMKDLRPFYTPRGYNSCFKRPLRFIAKREQSMWHSTRVSHYTCNPSQKKKTLYLQLRQECFQRAPVQLSSGGCGPGPNQIL